MLIRFVADNVYSFGKQTEFNTLPNSRLQTLKHHKYSQNGGFDLLKLSALYGANAAGKSNLVKSMKLLRNLVVRDKSATTVTRARFKLNTSTEPGNQVLAVEFVQEDTVFLFAVEIKDGRVATEELYLSKVKGDDILIYERTTNENNESDITFSKEFESDNKNLLLKALLLEEFIEPDKLILKFLSKRENEQLKIVQKAYNWFRFTFQILSPDSKPVALAHRFEIDEKFRAFAQEIIKSFHVGISDLSTKKQSLEEITGDSTNDREFAEEVRKAFDDSPDSIVRFRSNLWSEERVFEKEDNVIWLKSLRIGHQRSFDDDATVEFDLLEESDGTIKLLDLLPAIYDIIFKNRIYVIDELERSIHPVLIKELIKKFSFDEKSKGQLLFTTHESVLLDQELFRQDEIWFAEKDSNGCTDLYSLSDYKPHKTKDVRRGYLDGRYGAIPFLANLEDLNWHKYDSV